MKAALTGTATALLTVASVTAVHAAPTTYQPNEAASTDVFVYEFPMAAGIDLNAGGYGEMLPTLVSGSGHDLESLIRFDLVDAGITLDADERALLRLHVGDFTSSGFGANPQPGADDNPIVDFFTNTSAFTESTKWTTRPATAAEPFASVLVDDINQWIEIDITDVVSDWLQDPAGNYGLTLRQRSLVTREGEGKVGVLFDSAATANGPVLVVPEPTTLSLLAGGALMAMRRRRRLA